MLAAAMLRNGAKAGVLHSPAQGHPSMAFETQSLAMPAAANARERLFRENPRDMVERWALGAAWALVPKRIGGLPNLARLYVRELLSPDYALPDPEAAFADPPGLAGIVHDLS